MEGFQSSLWKDAGLCVERMQGPCEKAVCGETAGPLREWCAHRMQGPSLFLVECRALFIDYSAVWRDCCVERMPDFVGRIQGSFDRIQGFFG